MTSGVGIEIDETHKEDLDARTHGDLFHKIHHNLLLETLRFQEGESRDIKSVLSKKEPINISESNVEPENLMQRALSNLNEIAPWLNKSDAVSTNRIRMMTGMSIKDWENWTLEQKPVPLSGRIGRLIKEEFQLKNVIPIAIEWNLRYPNTKTTGIEIDLPS